MAYADRVVLQAFGASALPENEAPELWDILRRLAGRAGLPLPRLYIADSSEPNAFATGRNVDSASVCVTKGLLDRLRGDELEAVLAHEIAHIRNGDTPLMSLARTMTGVTAFSGLLGQIMARVLHLKEREFAADRTAAELCGRPHALASALEKICGGAGEGHLDPSNSRGSHRSLLERIARLGTIHVDPPSGHEQA